MAQHRLLDMLMDLLVEQGLCPADDVSFIGVTEGLFCGIPVAPTYCTFRAEQVKVYRGVEYRISPYARPAMNPEQLRGHVAFRMTKTTRDLLFGEWLKSMKAQQCKTKA